MSVTPWVEETDEIEHTPSMVERGLVSLSIFKHVKPNTYKFAPGKVVCACGDKGFGKTTWLACVGSHEMLPPVSDKRVMQARIYATKDRAKGCKKAYISPDLKHLVYSEIPMQTGADQGYLPRAAHVLDYERMILPSLESDVIAQFFPYGSLLIIDELINKDAAHDYAKTGGMSKPKRSFLSLIRQRGIRVVTTSLVPTGADKGYRDMCKNFLLFVHRVDDTFNGKPRTIWYALEFFNDTSCAKFYADPKKYDGLYEPYIFLYNGDIHKVVDSEGQSDEFLVGMENREYDIKDWEVKS